MKAMIVGGGTGGHIIPGINIARELTRLGYEIVYIGSCFGMEKNIDIEYRKYFLPISGWVREDMKKRIRFFPRILKSLILSFYITKKENPEFIILTGGFVTIPFIFVSIILNKPFFLIEINSIPGLASKISSYFSKITFTGFECTGKYLYHNRNIVFSGIPVSDRLRSLSREKSAEFFNFKKDKKTILIFGGSRGSKTINNISEELIKRIPEYQFIILGREDISNERVKSMNFLNEMEYAYNLCDFVISRAGAMTCGEIFYLQKPAILIPYPYAYKDHQFMNAKELKKSMEMVYVIKENKIIIDEFIRIIKNFNYKSSECNIENPSKTIAERIDQYVRGI